MARALLLFALWLNCIAPAVAQPDRDEPALSQVVRDLCGRKLALLGESSTHGNGRTDAFRAALVERLVQRCGFDAVFFEASHYDFLAFDRARRSGTATREMLASAIGGLWNSNAEVQPLIDQLFAEAQAGRVALGGLDAQLGSAGAFYSLEAMPEELAAALPEPRRSRCRAALRRRIHWAYDAMHPHDPGAIAELQGCLTDMRTSAPALQRQMLESIGRAISADFAPPDAANRARDAAMHANFDWLVRRLRPGARIIVWAATVHLAKNASDAGFPAGGNLGEMLHRAYGKRSFVLGFSALGGSYRYSRRENREVPPAPAGSLEAAALTDIAADTGYIGPARIASLGAIPGAGIRHAYQTLDWSRVLDGIVVFRAEHPPVTVR